MAGWAGARVGHPQLAVPGSFAAWEEAPSSSQLAALSEAHEVLAASSLSTARRLGSRGGPSYQCHRLRVARGRKKSRRAV